MALMLSNIGHRHMLAWVHRGLSRPDAGFALDAERAVMIDIRTPGSVPESDTPVVQGLLRRGLLQVVPDDTSREELELRYQRNPLENLSRVIFEFTSRCNFRCLHCYNAAVPRSTETDTALLCAAADLFAMMGVLRFDFIGGEVTRFGDGWLDVARHAAGHEGATVSVTTNGWWLTRQRFTAAGRQYAHDAELLEHLADNGVTHVLFSVDGHQPLHDRSRKHPGLYSRILDGFGKVRRAGLEPRVSLLVRSDGQVPDYIRLAAELAMAIYDLPPGTDPWEAAVRLRDDPFNKLSSLIDVGNHAGQGDGGVRLDQLPAEFLRCKAFYRPAPSLTIKANGEVSTCRITNAGEGYGNIHQKDLAQILNTMQDRFIFQLHAEQRLGEYVPYVDPELFGQTFNHMCSARAVLTRLALRMKQQGVDPADAHAMARLNRQVARETGHLSEQEWRRQDTDR